jgi:hypothetical protein
MTTKRRGGRKPSQNAPAAPRSALVNLWHWQPQSAPLSSDVNLRWHAPAPRNLRARGCLLESQASMLRPAEMEMTLREVGARPPPSAARPLRPPLEAERSRPGQCGPVEGTGVPTAEEAQCSEQPSLNCRSRRSREPGERDERGRVRRARRRVPVSGVSPSRLVRPNAPATHRRRRLESSGECALRDRAGEVGVDGFEAMRQTQRNQAHSQCRGRCSR